MRGDAAAALDVARIALLSLGFEILTESDTELHVRGPGMQSNRELALLGASALNLRVTSSAISDRATLGGVATLKAFLYLFPPVLALSLALVSALTETGGWWVSLLCGAPWIFLSPWMPSALERRATKAVDRLVSGIASARARSS